MIEYVNNSTNSILKEFRNTKYAMGDMTLSVGNFIERELKFVLDVNQISLQADIFSRGFMTHRSDFDFKRFLGSSDIDWLRLLHETYVYDRVRSIYYGLNSHKLLSIPELKSSFPGNILLFHFLSNRSYSYSTMDMQPYSYNVKISTQGTLKVIDFLKPVFDAYPNINHGISDDENVVSYSHPIYDGILLGMRNGKEYMETKLKKNNTNGLFFELYDFNDSRLTNFLLDSNNPLSNSFLSEDGTKFFFTLPAEKSPVEALKFNESVFISRALGFRGDQLMLEGNPFYTVVSRKEADIFTKDEVYSVTGLKTEFVPYSRDQINKYLQLDSYKLVEKEILNASDSTSSGGSNTTNFQS